MSNLTGQSLGRYNILEQLGEGGMATVYKAYDTRLERDVAVKIIRRAAFAPDQLERILKRFEREAKALARLSHPNIVGVVDYGDFEGSPYLVMEFLPSGTLKQRIGKPIPWQEAVRLVLPIARALQFSHGQGIIHRDIKPSNILITLSGEPMLSDFGIAKILESGETATLTGTGIGVGTPEYMAPEQWVGKVTPQSDIYSLGMVLYEMITGCKPYTADTPAAILLKQATEPLPRPIQFVPNLPEVVEKVLLKALARKPEDRYKEMTAFADNLEHLVTRHWETKKPVEAGKVIIKNEKPQPDTRGRVSQAELPEARIQEATRDELHPQPSGSPAWRSAVAGIPTTFRKWQWAVGILIVGFLCAIILSAGGLISLSMINQGVAGEPNNATTAPVDAEGTPAPETAEDTLVPTVEEIKPVTISWWRNKNIGGDSALWQKFADEYTDLHPNVTIIQQEMEYEDFKNQLSTAMQSGAPPDIFHSWGGYTLDEHANAGWLKDITADLDADGGAWRNTFAQGALGIFAYKGRNYGVPWDMGMIGVWYNKALFDQAGIGSINTPATWTDFLDDIRKLKAAGITPIALAEGDKWPGTFWWAYLATRIGGKANFEGALYRTGSFTDRPFVEAGEKIRELAATNPFQTGFLSTTYLEQEIAMGNGKVAMELMGQWSPGVMNSNGVGIGDNLGWFPFPMIEGGAGDPSDAMGGGNGFAIGKNAPPEAIGFVRYLTSAAVQSRQASIGVIIPVVKGSEKGLNDPWLITVQKEMAKAKYLQLYYDQALPPSMGSVLNDIIQAIFAGTITPQEAARALENSAATEIPFGS